MKTLRKLRIEENFLNLIKGICEEPRANIILIVEILNSFSLISEIRQIPFLTTSIQYYTRDSCWCNKVRKEMKVIQMKSKIKLSLFIDNGIIYAKHLVEYIKIYENY